LANLDQIQAALGHTAAQVLIRAIGTFISKHFGDVGGFSTRYGMNQYTTVLPYSDVQEATALAETFAEDFRKNGIPEMRKFVQTEIECQDGISITMLAGVAQGTPGMDIEPIVATARANRKKILEFSARCKGRQA
jgi:GGDEF domain-containing protein